MPWLLQFVHYFILKQQRCGFIFNTQGGQKWLKKIFHYKVVQKKILHVIMQIQQDYVMAMAHYVRH